ncbi:hypothetical protein GJ496_002181 [Pomphorhynchus laevis]|nr:hypothetical protein GJ496_002181 [Pomphorhynchus laevis]
MLDCMHECRQYANESHFPSNDILVRKLFENLPTIAVIKILSYLPCEERLEISLCCKRWFSLLDCIEVWTVCLIRFCTIGDVKFLTICKRHGHVMKHVKITIDQTEHFNRINSRVCFQILSPKRNKQLRQLVIRCIGHNPLFYKSDKYIDSLRLLLDNRRIETELYQFKEGNLPLWANSLRAVDFEGLLVAIPDSLVLTIAACHRNIRSINLLDASLVCCISNEALVELISSCPCIENLAIFRKCLSRKAMLIFACRTTKRKRLKQITLLFRHDEKFSESIDEEMWMEVVKYNPQLQISLIFDPSCQQHRIASHILPILPVTRLSIHSTIRSTHEIDLASLFYSDTLKELELKYEVEWAMSPSPILDTAIRNLVTQSKALEVLRIHCGLSEKTLSIIDSKYPKLNSHKRTILCKEINEEI